MAFFISVLVVVLMMAIDYRAMTAAAMGLVAAGIALPSLFGVISGIWLYVGATLMGPDDDKRKRKALSASERSAQWRNTRISSRV
jgi:hypothetical protein